jgi:hypothetical protein
VPLANSPQTEFSLTLRTTARHFLRPLRTGPCTVGFDPTLPDNFEPPEHCRTSDHHRDYRCWHDLRHHYRWDRFISRVDACLCRRSDGERSSKWPIGPVGIDSWLRGWSSLRPGKRTADHHRASAPFYRYAGHDECRPRRSLNVYRRKTDLRILGRFSRARYGPSAAHSGPCDHHDHGLHDRPLRFTTYQARSLHVCNWR